MEGMERLSLAWGWLSPDGEVEVNLDELSAATTAKVVSGRTPWLRLPRRARRI